MECTTAQFLALHLPEKALAAGIIIRIALFRERLYDIAFVQKAAEGKCRILRASVRVKNDILRTASFFIRHIESSHGQVDIML